jgi:hypothetical protein
VEVAAEANQAALNSLARECLPEGCEIVKGPAIHREAKRVAITVRVPASGGGSSFTDGLKTARQCFEETSGFELAISVLEQAASRLASFSTRAGRPALSSKSTRLTP